MPDIIKSGDSGYTAHVDENNRLHTHSKSEEPQHVVAHESESAYQLIGTATLSSGTVPVIHLKNTDAVKDIVVTYIRHQVLGQAGGTAFPNASNYFTICLNRTYSSGGTLITPVNTTAGSGGTALATAYGSGPTLAGTSAEIDRWYTKAEGDMNSFNKGGAVIVPPNQTIEFSYVGDQSSGTIYVRVSFYFEKGGE